LFQTRSGRILLTEKYFNLCVSGDCLLTEKRAWRHPSPCSPSRHQAPVHDNKHWGGPGCSL